jgi:ribonuclease VapC
VIVVDTSALMALALNEAAADFCSAALETTDKVLISAGTAAEAMIVAARRGVSDEMSILINDLEIEVIPVTSASAHRAGDAYRQWGKGFHPAALNFGDCFAYVLAQEHDCPLLFVGNDFARTDVKLIA